jgi:hypothetical protein
MKKVHYFATAGIALALVASTSGIALADSGSRSLFLKSASENTVADTATLPLYRGNIAGAVVWYVVTESSDQKDAEARGVNYSPKLALAKGTAAVQKAGSASPEVSFAGSVDFAPNRVVVPSATGFPPLAASPGSIGDSKYSPLVQLPNGIVLNAPHIANASGLHDKLVGAPDFVGRKATFKETEGFYNGKEVYYVSFESSAPDIAALEGATFASNLNAAPGLGSNDPKSSARSGIAPFVNGQTGVNNPQRQGLNSALLGEGDPLNVVQSAPHNEKYSPLWDVHATQWSAAAVANRTNTLQTKFEEIAKLGEIGTVTGPGGGKWGAIGAIVNCPVVSRT